MAFELALSTSDLQLVMYLCHQVTPEEVFDKIPCPLSQPVLLSLIQQLSVNLNDQIELKTRYASLKGQFRQLQSEGFSVTKLEIENLFLMVVTNEPFQSCKSQLRSLFYTSLSCTCLIPSLPIPLPLSHSIPSLSFHFQSPIPFQPSIPFPGT